jgi:hypothetical protein
MEAAETSYKVSVRIATAGKPHIPGESLLLPTTKDKAISVFEEKAAKQLESIPLSNNTLSRRISDMASNIKEQLIEKVKASKFYTIQWMKVVMLAT